MTGSREATEQQVHLNAPGTQPAPAPTPLPRSSGTRTLALRLPHHLRAAHFTTSFHVIIPLYKNSCILNALLRTEGQRCPVAQRQHSLASGERLTAQPPRPCVTHGPAPSPAAGWVHSRAHVVWDGRAGVHSLVKTDCARISMVTGCLGSIFNVFRRYLYQYERNAFHKVSHIFSHKSYYTE